MRIYILDHRNCYFITDILRETFEMNTKTYYHNRKLTNSCAITITLTLLQ